MYTEGLECSLDTNYGATHKVRNVMRDQRMSEVFCGRISGYIELYTLEELNICWTKSVTLCMYPSVSCIT